MQLAFAGLHQTDIVGPMERYQDYVIKDGKFVGAFEEMYRKFEDPWHQSEPQAVELSVGRQAACAAISRHQIKSVVEFGCGKGHFANLISHLTNAKVCGVDIAPTAIEKARALFPATQFEVGQVKDLPRYRGFDAILFSEVTGYLLPELKTTFDLMREHFAGKYFIHNLVFYPKGVQQYGKDYFSSLEEFLEFCPFPWLEKNVWTPNQPNAVTVTSVVFKITRK